MIDGHIHIERGKYTLEWIEQFVNHAMEKRLQEIRLLEHNYIFEEFSSMFNRTFYVFLKDDIALKFRRMLMVERYRNSELNNMYEELFINGAVEYEEKLFCNMIEAGIIKKEDPHIIALRFYTPIFYLLQKYDMHPDKEEEAKEELIAMVREFCETYKGLK